MTPDQLQIKGAKFIETYYPRKPENLHVREALVRMLNCLIDQEVTDAECKHHQGGPGSFGIDPYYGLKY